jgi:uncharacterized membrane protein YebE (DUF533 family)
MAKKLDLSALVDVLPEILKVVDSKWDSLSDDAVKVAKKAKSAAKQASAQVVVVGKKQAKNPVAQWITVGLAVALVAGVAYALYKPDEDDLWQQAEDELGQEDAN